MKLNFTLSAKKILFFSAFLFLFISVNKTFATNYTSNTSGNWNNSSVWTPAGIPSASDNVTITAGKTININVASSCSSLTINTSGTVNFSSAVICNVSGTLAVSGTITGSSTGTFSVFRMEVPSGTIGSIGRSNISVTDSLVISGSYVVTSVTGTKTFANLLLNSAGDWTNTGSAAAAFTITGDLIFYDGSSIKGNNTSNITVNGDFICKAGIGYADIGRCNLTINGLLDIYGDLRFIIVSGTKTFNGGITIHPGAELDNTIGLDLFINGNIENNGGWNDASGNVTYTFGGGSSLTISGNSMHMAQISVSAGTTLTNRAHLTVSKSNGITGLGSFYNGDGTTDAHLDIESPSGINVAFFDFSSPGNTVEYNRAGIQTIEIPNGSQYYNLIIDGSASTKNLNANITILGDILIQSTLDANSNTITVKGDWENLGTFTYGTSTVVFNGTTDQTISAPYNPAGETFYKITVNKSSGDLIMNDDVTARNTLTMTSGIIENETKELTLGISTGSVGTLTYTSGIITGKFKRWINSTGTGILFPIGTENDYRPALITFSDLSNGTAIAEFIETAPENNGLSLVDGLTVYNSFSEGYWSLISGDGLSSTNYNLELTGNGMSSFNILGTTRLLKRSNAISPWIANGTHVSATGSTAKRSSLSGVNGEYAFGDLTNCTPPSPTSAITGSNSVCTNQTGEIYSVTNNVGNTYVWSITGGSIASGQGTNSITVNWGNTGRIGNLRVVENNGCTNASPVNLLVEIHALPVSVITGYLSVAANSTSVGYSVVPRAGYTYNWTVSSSTIASGQGTNAITIDFGGVNNETLTCTASNACGSATPVDLEVVVYRVINSVATGNWNNPTTWDCNCIPQASNSVRIDSSHTVTLVANTSVKNFIIKSFGIFDNSSNVLTISADYINNGIHNGTQRIDLIGDESIIDGSGVINNSGELRIDNYSKYIFATANLNKTVGALRIMSGLIITNNGTLTLAGNLIGNSGTSKWINSINSTLNAGDAVMTTGVLNATALGNTVNYNSSTAQTIKNAFGNSYYNLKTSGGLVKSLNGNLTVLGNLEITGTSSLDVTAIDYNLDVQGNWINTSAHADPFQQRNAIVTFSGTEAIQTITNANGENFYKLTLNKSEGNLSLSSPIFVSNLLTLTEGIIITTATNVLTINDNATSTSGNSISYVDGPMQKIGDDAFVFPLGNSTYWARLEIGAPSNPTDAFTAQYFATGFSDVNTMATTPSPVLNNVSLGEYWTCDRTTGSSNVKVKLYWEDANRSGIANYTSDLVVAHWNGSAWENAGQTAITASNPGNLTSNTLSSFSPFAFGSLAGSSPLPIELVEFTAKLNSNKKTDIEWTTATEINSDYFNIERSADGIVFENIQTLAAAGNSTYIINYATIDQNPLKGVSYYRLKQIDFDGNFTYSQIASINNDDSSMEVNLFPNPSFDGAFNLDITGSENEEILVVLYNANGQMVYSKAIITTSNQTRVAIETSGELPSGIYWVTGTSKNELFRKKLIVQ